ncbi:MAG: hypothetical protein KI785_04455 [Devosiaceae bacterium]|nr:hypothetical protein [Devosiaceae bacterium MH13]
MTITDKDLESITEPFGLLSPEMKEALKGCGGPWEVYNSAGCDVRHDPVWLRTLTYRKKFTASEPLVVWGNVYRNLWDGAEVVAETRRTRAQAQAEAHRDCLRTTRFIEAPEQEEGA